MQQFQSGFEDFRRRNPWYGQDRIMSSAADMAGEWLLRNDPNVSPDDYYSFVEEKIREDYPGRMSNPNKQRQSVSSPRSPSKEGGTAWEKVTRTNPELKEAFSEWVEMGTFKDTKEDREKYAKMYLEVS